MAFLAKYWGARAPRPPPRIDAPGHSPAFSAADGPVNFSPAPSTHRHTPEKRTLSSHSPVQQQMYLISMCTLHNQRSRDHTNR